MKCPNCGAEATGKFCQFCGSEMPQNNPIIINNYYNSTNKSNDVEQNPHKKCPNCGGLNTTFNREKTQTIINKDKYQKREDTIRKTVGYCKDCGFTWIPTFEEKEPTKKQTASLFTPNRILWILGWIFCFPIPLSIIIAKSKKLNPLIKGILITFIWLIILIYGGLSQPDTDSAYTDSSYVQTSESINYSTKTEETEKSDLYQTQIKCSVYDKNYMFAVEVDGFDGDILESGTYTFSVKDSRFTSASNNNGVAQTPGLYEIYIRKDKSSKVSDLTSSECDLCVGGTQTNPYSYNLEKGDYVYVIPFRNISYEPTGYLSIEKQ